VRTNLLHFAKVTFVEERCEYPAAAGHGEYVALLAKQGAPIQSLPFPGAIYVLHADANDRGTRRAPITMCSAQSRVVRSGVES